MVDPVGAPAWMAKVQETLIALRWADRQAQEAACEAIKDRHGEEAAGKLRELFEAEHARFIDRANKITAVISASEIKPEKSKPAPSGIRAGYELSKWGDLRRKIAAAKPKPVAGAKPDTAAGGVVVALKPMEQAKPELEPEPVESDEKEWNGLLDREAPLDNARKMIGFKYWHKSAMVPKLRFWQNEFWEWQGKHWKAVDKDTMRAIVYKFSDEAEQQIRGGHRVRFQPTDTDVNKTVDALKAEANLTPDHQMPGWLLGPAPIDNLNELVAMQNGLLHVPTRKLLEHSPRFWSPNVLEFRYDPKARAPRFERFLEEIFPGDGEAQQTSLEMIGLCVTDETKYQKAFMFVGPRRGGRGTIGRLLRGLVGEENYVGANLRKMSVQFGMQTWIGKKVVIFPDVRTDGMRLDKLSAVSESLLSVTGEDGIDVERKYLGTWSGKLTARVIMFSNELVKFQDDSGALPGRFITWRMRQSFWGKEDLSLTDKLLAERPGILNLALKALDRLRDRGHFIQPACGAEMSESLELIASGIASFVKECCEVGPEYQDFLGNVYLAWREWCTIKGVRYAWMEQHFSEKLRAAVATINTARPRKDNSSGRPTLLIGIRLRKTAKRL